MADDDQIEGDFEGVWYHWTCGACGAMNETEFDVRDQQTECDACGARNIVRGSL